MKNPISAVTRVWVIRVNLLYDMNSSAHWRWYQEQFEPGKYQIKGEMTPFYATLSEQRVAFIKKKLPRLKVIYIIRNPVKRAWSGFRLFWFLETKHQECHLENEILRKTIMYPAKLIHGDYRRNTDVWEKCFNRDRILYLFYDDIVQKPQRVLDRVLTFLEVTPLQLSALDIAERVNRAPAVSMPEPIEMELTDYYSTQMAFIKAKFGRTLDY
jgi:hypothetical protein